MTDHTLRKKIEAIKRQQIVSKKVVSLSDFRALKMQNEIQTILVVDNDEVMRGALKRILEGEGYNVTLAADGLELSRILETTRLDLILLDVGLPWIDGIELCRLIKGHHNFKNVPVILMSTQKSKEDIEKGITAGANDYITKPFEVDNILKAINRLLLGPLLERT